MINIQRTTFSVSQSNNTFSMRGFYTGALFSAALSLEMLSVFIVTFIFNAVYPIANDAGYPGATFYLVDLFLLIPLVLNL